jgi:tetrahydromethanopterin S-methyltransferase subunit B
MSGNVQRTAPTDKDQQTTANFLSKASPLEIADTLEDVGNNDPNAMSNVTNGALIARKRIDHNSRTVQGKAWRLFVLVIVIPAFVVYTVLRFLMLINEKMNKVIRGLNDKGEVQLEVLNSLWNLFHGADGIVQWVGSIAFAVFYGFAIGQLIGLFSLQSQAIWTRSTFWMIIFGITRALYNLALSGQAGTVAKALEAAGEKVEEGGEEGAGTGDDNFSGSLGVEGFKTSLNGSVVPEIYDTNLEASHIPDRHQAEQFTTSPNPSVVPEIYDYEKEGRFVPDRELL